MIYLFFKAKEEGKRETGVSDKLGKKGTTKLGVSSLKMKTYQFGFST